MTEEIVVRPPQPICSAETAIAALSSEDDGIRYYAAWWLGKHRVQDACEALCEALKDERDRTALGGYPLRRQAARSLGLLKNSLAVPALIEVLECPDLRLQEAAIHALATIEDRAAIPGLLALFDLEGEIAAEALLEALATFEVWEARLQVEKFYSHPSERVQCAAARYLYALTRESTYLQKLLQTLEHENHFLRWAATFDLGGLGLLEVAPALIKAFVPNSIKLLNLKRILERLLQNEAIAEVQRQKESDFLFDSIDGLLIELESSTRNALDASTRLEVSEESIREMRSLEALVIAQQDETGGTQDESVSPVAALIAALRSKHPKVRAAAIDGLVELAPATVKPLIEAYESSNDHGYQACLIQAIARIGDPRALELLQDVVGVEIANHCQGNVRRVAALGLGRIGRQAPGSKASQLALKKLDWALRMPEDWALRYSAAVSLEEIGSTESMFVLQTAANSEIDLVVQTRIARALAAIL
ncbi:HEAT domain containing protein [Rubidibacter lacunae KORDI 51-2]|uniref:HEAT domain containing protein n=2 Tax=Rubidibacter TaxID=582491 RepID=U5DQK4_9CHRO|nr:HEAT domain containing protein [Rubidibacter lacunae KORDI 51-2]